jgi:hypothetical protein
MSFYDKARQRARQRKSVAHPNSQVADTTKTGYTRKVEQRSDKQDNARQK